MPLNATSSGGSTTPPIPAGTYQAVCYSVVDLGTHTGDYMGQQKRQHKIRITWEVPSERMKITKDGQELDLPRVIGKSYTLSLHEKSSLFADLTSWRGKAFTPDELKCFDVYNVLKANCLLTIVAGKSNDGKPFAKVSSLGGLMKGMKRLEPESQILSFSLQEDGMNLPAGMPEWMAKDIKDSEEYRAMEHARSVMGNDANDLGDLDNEPAPQDDEDSIPF
jgi:hypothetical protein